MRTIILMLVSCFICSNSNARDDTGFPVGYIAAIIKICSEGKANEEAAIEERVLAANCVPKSQMADQKKMLEYHRTSKDPRVRAAFDPEFESTMNKAMSFTKSQKDEMCQAMTRMPTSC